MLDILYEDNHLIVVNKKAGDIVQGDKTGDTPLSEYVKKYVKKKFNKPGDVFLGTIHRLDRPTSGIVIYARTSKALSRMNKLFREREVKKTYWAIVENNPPNQEGLLNDYLKKNTRQNKSYITNTIDGKSATLRYKLIKKLDNYFLLEIIPETGRHHQIRTQLANIGCIIVGDLKYGAKRSNKDGSINLLAKSVEFVHPIKKEKIIITSPNPKSKIWDAC
jgi:23S rRNA pseudouridine1911/1915/1917 synthase